ncbi:MAG: hypothetical protein JW864_14125 [Spirochaetes bacterium]|nr:hypothetical protein [Spirochaetota bacterium]
MADQLQSLKLDISKHASLDTYERVAFHKILGILKTESGMQVLLRELPGDPLVRESAISILKDFDYIEVQNAFLPLLNNKITNKEKGYILDYFEKYGTADVIEPVIDFIENNKADPELPSVLPKAFKVLSSVGEESDIVNIYLRNLASDPANNTSLRSLAIVALSVFVDIVNPDQNEGKSFLEDILKEDTGEIVESAYNSLSLLNDRIIEKIQKNKKDEEELFTYSPEQQDRAMLDIRVLIGKMTPRFDTYSNRVKISLINAMISSNHRELLIYLMKALSLNDWELIDMTLNLLVINAHKLVDPDKLFRNLISLSMESPKGNKIIVEIFIRFFSSMKETRRNVLFRDKMYNYIVVTLETYFETYRKEFMVAEVMEKNFPENVQKIRQFILKKFTSSYKKKLLGFLRSNDFSMLDNILTDISGFIPFVHEKEEDELYCLLESLYEKDFKSREISAARIEDLDFEKRYIKERIVRLCSIIGHLKIENAASQLVIIYNYLKKYTDSEIMDAVSYALSMLNYSYMLGELEVLLSTGDVAEQHKAVEYLSLFSDQRSINIILDYLKQNQANDSDVVTRLLLSLLRQDLFGNITADAILKEIIKQNPNHRIKSLAILSLGRCGREPDIMFLDEQFKILKNNNPKEAIVQAMEYISDHALDINLRPLKKFLLEYVKDPGIKVRIYSCYLLLKYGSINALKNIMDMMKIKNKDIQREIISLFSNLKSVDFAYFCISLLKDEYAIAGDIISLLSLLPVEELKEIDHFIVNIFKKLEFAGIKKTTPTGEIQYNNNEFPAVEKILLNIQITNFQKKVADLSIIEIILLYQQINDLIISEIVNNKGMLSKIANGTILAYFDNPVDAANTTLSINNNFIKYNTVRLPEDRITLYIFAFNEKIRIINEEIINLDISKTEYKDYISIGDRVIMDDSIIHSVGPGYSFEPLPNLDFARSTFKDNLYELLTPVNFKTVADRILEDIKSEIDTKRIKEIELEKEVREQKQRTKSTTAIAYAQALDDLGRTLKDDLANINKYIQKRTTDRELISNVDKMLSNVYKRYFVEKSKIFSEIESE